MPDVAAAATPTTGGASSEGSSPAPQTTPAPTTGMDTAVSTWVRGTVATTMLTCTFSTSGTNTCNCFCP